MFNKIYKNIRNFIHENLGSIIIILITLFITQYRVNYYIITGGGTFDAKERVELKTKNK